MGSDFQAGRGGPLSVSRVAQWSLFLCVAAAALWVCYCGGRFGLIGLRAGRFIVLYSVTWAICLGAVLVFPRGLRFGYAAAIIVALAVLCRALLASHVPSDDMNRYVWEGRVLGAGHSPYVLAPDDPALGDLRDSVWEGINHPDMTACYPPLMVLMFGGVVWIADSLGAMKLTMVLFDLGTLVLLLALLRGRKLGARWGFLYALNPVVLYSFAGQGHLDSVQLFFLTAALAAHASGRWRWMFLFAGLAVQSKYVAVLALPFLIRRDNVRHLWVALAAMSAPCLLFASDGLAVLDSIVAFGFGMAANGPVHTPLRTLLGGIDPASIVCYGLLAAILAWGCWRLHPERGGAVAPGDPIPGVLLALGALLVLSPTVHFWYVCWIVPLVVLRPSASWIVLCLSIASYFQIVGIAHWGGEWKIPSYVLWLEWTPFAVLLLWEWWRIRTRARNRVPAAWNRKIRTVSVVVPALNEEENIARCVGAIRDSGAVEEVIVVDGGSNDATAERAGEAGAIVVEHRAGIECGGGRGGQIRAGVARARGDVVAVLHADMAPAPETFSRIVEVLDANPDVVGGAAGSVFDDAGLRLRIVEWANDFRAAVLGVGFGDQVQFFRRRPVVEADLVPAIPLMEDVELSLRLKTLGRTIYLWEENIVSARHWRRGAVRRSILIVRLVAEYCLVRLWKDPDTVAMYRKYYAERASNGAPGDQANA